MSNFSLCSLKSVALITLGLAIGAVASLGTHAPKLVSAAPTATSFPDIKAHWARPFIEALATKKIVSGYLDGTFRPNQPVDRDEFAAIISKAFNQKQVRQLSSGSIYKDVPSGYWAAPAIKEAYETGFMNGYPGGFFRPRTEISRVQALVSITNGLNMSSSSPTTTLAATHQPTAQSIANQPSTRRVTKKRFFVPLAITSLMQPLFSSSGNAQSTPSSSQTSSLAKSHSVSTNTPPSFTVSNYYADAKNIPLYAVDDVAAATKANIVVSYPNTKVLNPNQPATRGDVAAFVYQALVAQGKMKPISSKAIASNYIVGTSSK